MGKMISLKEFKLYKEIERKDSEPLKENQDLDDMNERIFLETNTECADFEELWEM